MKYQFMELFVIAAGRLIQQYRAILSNLKMVVTKIWKMLFCLPLFYERNRQNQHSTRLEQAEQILKRHANRWTNMLKDIRTNNKISATLVNPSNVQYVQSRLLMIVGILIREFAL